MATIQITSREELFHAVNQAALIQEELEDLTNRAGYRIYEAVRKAFNWLTQTLRMPLPPLPLAQPARTFVDLTKAIDCHVQGSDFLTCLPTDYKEAADDLLLMLEIRRIRHIRESLLGLSSPEPGPVDGILDDRIRQDDLFLKQKVESLKVEAGQPPIYPIPLNPTLPTVFQEFRSAFSAGPEAMALFEELLKNGHVQRFYLLERSPNCVRYRLELKRDLSASRMFGMMQARITRDLEFKFTDGKRMELTKGTMCVKAPILGYLSYNEIEYLDEKDAPDPEKKRRLLIVGYKAVAVDECLALLRKYDIELK